MGLVCVCVCLTQCVQVCLLVSVVSPQVSIGFLGMFLFVLSSFRVFVSEDEVQFVILSTFVRSKHDGVRSFIYKLVLSKRTYSLGRPCQEWQQHRVNTRIYRKTH